MKIACFIPIKTNSERVKGKNFRILGKKKLYEHIIENAINASVFDDIYVDTDSDEIKEYAINKNINVIDRKKELASNNANGNDLLIHHYNMYSDYDFYFQMFATSPYLSTKTIRDCVNILTQTNEYDSIFTVIQKKGFFWYADLPINYIPGVLPRSQDLKPIYEETTALYGIKNQSLKRYNCRIGYKPYM